MADHTRRIEHSSEGDYGGGQLRFRARSNPRSDSARTNEPATEREWTTVTDGPESPRGDPIYPSTVRAEQEQDRVQEQRKRELARLWEQQGRQQGQYDELRNQEAQERLGRGSQRQSAPSETPYRAHNPWSRHRSHSPPIDLSAHRQFNYAFPYGRHPPVIPQDGYSRPELYGYGPPSPYVDVPSQPLFVPNPQNAYANGSTPPVWLPTPPAVSQTTPLPARDEKLASSPWSRQSAPNASTPFSASLLGREPLLELGYSLLVTIPQEIYMIILLRLPRFYFSRVKKVFEDAELSKPDIVRIYTTSAKEWQEREKSRHDGPHRSRLNFAKLPTPSWTPPGSSDGSEITPAMAAFKDSWESLINSLLQEWNTLNIISALLSASILTLLSLDGTANDPITRTASIISLLCSLWSIVYASMYIVRFGPMRKMHKAASWAEEAQRKINIFWNVWALLAMPAVWLVWSLIGFFVAIMSYVWRTNSVNSPDSRTTSANAALGTRIAITCVLGIGAVYFFAMLNTFRSYGDSMDQTWKRNMAELANQAWLQQMADIQSSDHPLYYSQQQQSSYPHYPSPAGYPIYRPRQHMSAEMRPYSHRSSPPPLPPFIPPPPGSPRGTPYMDEHEGYTDPRPSLFAYRPSPQPTRRSSLRSPSRPPRRSSTGDELSVRLQHAPEIINTASYDASYRVASSPADVHPAYGRRYDTPPGPVNLSTISERTTVPSRPSSIDYMPLYQTLPGLAAIRATGLQFSAGMYTPVPQRLYERNVSDNIWQKFLQDVRAAWKTGFPPGVPTSREIAANSTEAVFHVCRVYASMDFAPFHVHPVLCEEHFRNGSVGYAVYVIDAADIGNPKLAFRKLPEDVQEIVLLWNEAPWHDVFRRDWTIRRDRSGGLLYHPHPETRSSEASGVEIPAEHVGLMASNEVAVVNNVPPVAAHASSSTPATILEATLSSSPESLGREANHSTRQETREGSPDDSSRQN